MEDIMYILAFSLDTKIVYEKNSLLNTRARRITFLYDLLITFDRIKARNYNVINSLSQV